MRMRPTTLTELTVILSVTSVLLAYGLILLLQPQQMLDIASVSKAHSLAIALHAYAFDHKQQYPYASTSTIAFQNLYELKYLTQPDEVYLTSRNGKALADKKNPFYLSSINVSFELVTRLSSGLTESDPDDLPIVFSEVLAAPNWTPGVNQARIDDSCPWGTEGVTIATLGMAARFVRPQPSSNEVELTSTSFAPNQGVVYKTLVP